MDKGYKVIRIVTVVPVALFLYFGMYGAAAVGTVLVVLVFVASMETKRHTFFQLIGGGLVPLISIVVIGLYFQHTSNFLI